MDLGVATARAAMLPSMRSLGAANIPCHLEPTGLYRSNGKWPDGMSIIPWKRGKVLICDPTCPDTLAPSYNTPATKEAGSVAEEAEKKKRTKYAHLQESHYFVPVAVETMGVFGPKARSFLQELGHPIANATQDPLSHLHLRQRILVAVQRGNAAATSWAQPWDLTTLESFRPIS